jgi:hypothetical protein
MEYLQSDWIKENDDFSETYSSIGKFLGSQGLCVAAAL